MESDGSSDNGGSGSSDEGQRQPSVLFKRTPEFVEEFSGLLSSVEESSRFLADDRPQGTYDLFETFSRSLAEFQAYVNLFGPKKNNPFLVFLHACIHEINNPLQVLIFMCEQPDGFDLSTYELNRQKILEGVQLLRSGEPPKANFNLKNLAEELAASHDMRVLCTESYDASSEVRLSPVILKWVLENLKRGADTVNGHPANVTLVLDSDPGVDGAPPQLRVYFVSDCEDTPLTPEHFQGLIKKPPENGQNGGRGIHYTNRLLCMAQRPSYFREDGESCLRFRKEGTENPLSLKDRQILSLSHSPCSFLFEIDLSGVKVLNTDEQFNEVFTEAVKDVLPKVDDVLSSFFIESSRDVLFGLFSGGGNLDDILKEIPEGEGDDDLRFDFSRLVSGLRQRLNRVAA